ncbi:MAG TPA: CHAT domain-containing protein [Thermoanaerobaculia bacterium]|jgi:CHAT domain-containing protein|nr:CHAT domain-containing protein [Thermoanaerobaculia bacterium]
MKNPLCIVLCLCSAFMACDRENTKTSTERDRPVEARLNGAEHRPYRQHAVFQMSCEDEVVDSREKALRLLAGAGGDCIDKALRAVERHAKEDLAAAYLTRFERKHDLLDLLRALETAKGFNRALALERLYLTKEAIHSWNEIVQERSDWSGEARQHIQRLQQLPNPVRQWNAEALVRAVQRRDRDALTRMVRAFPANAAQQFERLDLRDREGARLLANALVNAGEHYPQAVVDAMDRTRDRAALEQGLAALHARKYQDAVKFLERAGNPLSLAARYYVAAVEQSLPVLDATIPHLRPDYRELTFRIHTYRAILLDFDSRYLDAHADYEQALASAKDDPTTTAAVLARRSVNFVAIGSPQSAFRDAHQALSLLDRVADIDARHQAYGTAALAARQLGHPSVALYYQNAAVEDLQRAVNSASNDDVATAKHHLSIALRRRAEIHLELERHADAQRDLDVAADLAEAVALIADRDLLRMRILEVQGQLLLKGQPADAVRRFSEVIENGKALDSTSRAILYFQRAAARRAAGDPRADDDIATALHILRDEVRHALTSDPQAASEPLWTPYFSRFRDQYDELIERRIDANDKEGSFVQSELALAFEPMQILLQSGQVPPGYRPVERVADLQQVRAKLPADTVILQFLVLRDRTFTWVVTREGIELVQQRTTKKKIEEWVADAVASIKGGQSDPLTRVLRAAYGELFREPLALVPKSKTRIVIVPDEPMQGLPFNALQGGRDEGYLIERSSVAVAGSTSLYLYALARDRQLSSNQNPSALLIGDPAFDSTALAFAEPLPFARKEVEELKLHHYSNAEVLVGADATVQKFLSAVKSATIIHFAGHALANPQSPWQSRLLFAPGPRGESGELSAQTLMQQLPRLERTRLAVLGACSTAGGSFVGPQGLAPLVRPLIAANVPAVVGTLWDVRDASAKELLVSFHCHYRHGDDVAVALRQAQLERLRKHEPANKWAAFQVVGHAASPYTRSIALEDPNSEHLCTQNSLQRPDGLHP